MTIILVILVIVGLYYAYTNLTSHAKTNLSTGSTHIPLLDGNIVSKGVQTVPLTATNITIPQPIQAGDGTVLSNIGQVPPGTDPSTMPPPAGYTSSQGNWIINQDSGIAIWVPN